MDPEQIQELWPGAFYKNAYNREGSVEQCFFVMEGDRYPMDFGGPRGFYQIDTYQDAPYFGLWCNPHTLQLVQYAEGDISLMDFHTPADYREHLAKIEQQMQGRVDDKDGKYWEKLLTKKA